MKSILCAFALFSRLPLPRSWSAMPLREESMRHLTAAFPLVGVVVGAAVLGWLRLCDALALGAFLRGTGCALLPPLLTGGIHMDGLADTADALASHGDAATKQRILRDPRAGAFAALAVSGYLLAFAALAAEGFASRRLCFVFALSFVLSRCVSGFAVLCIPAAPESGLARRFRDAAARRACLLVLCLWGAVLVAGMAWSGGAAGAAAGAASFLLLWRWRRMAAREFGGMSGDLSGCLLQLSELLSLALIVLVPKILERI